MSTAEEVTRTRPVFTVTRITRAGGHFQRSRYTLAVSTCPGQSSGPYTFGGLKSALQAAALLDPRAVLDTAREAWTRGTASVEGVIMTATAHHED